MDASVNSSFKCNNLHHFSPEPGFDFFATTLITTDHMPAFACASVPHWIGYFIRCLRCRDSSGDFDQALDMHCPVCFLSCHNKLNNAATSSSK